MQTEKGQSIEDASMRIIDEEIGSHHYDPMEWPIVRRVIHSTADFDFAGKNRIVFCNNAIRSGMDALKNGCSIVVDVNGVLGGSTNRTSATLATRLSATSRIRQSWRLQRSKERHVPRYPCRLLRAKLTAGWWQ